MSKVSWAAALAGSLMLAFGALPLVAATPEVSFGRLDGTAIGAREVDAIAVASMRKAGVPGLGIAIFDHGRIGYMRTYGERAIATHQPLTPDSVMTAASLTKPAFAVLVLQMVDRGILDLDRPVYEYLPRPLPEYPLYRDLAQDPRYKEITLRMLLDHTSGFPNWRRLTEDHRLRIYFKPGSRFAYSGEGIALAQLVVETITRKSIDQLMRENIFVPLGMARTSMLWEPRFETDYANAYDEQGASLGPQRWRHGDAAGSMQTTLRDYSRFVQAIMKGKLLSKKARRDLLHPQVRITSAHEFPTLSSATSDTSMVMNLSYGLGWGLLQTPYGKAFFKEGHDDGWRHYVVSFDEPKSGLLIMTNSSNGEDTYSLLLEKLIGDVFTPYEWEGFKPAPMQ